MPLMHMKKDLSEQPPPRKPKLLDEVRERLRAQYDALRTEEAYLGWIRRFILFHGKRHPREMGGREVARFLSSLATRDEVSPSTQNQAFSALLFLYRQVLQIPLDDLGPVKRAQRARKVPRFSRTFSSGPEEGGALGFFRAEVWSVGQSRKQLRQALPSRWALRPRMFQTGSAPRPPIVSFYGGDRCSWRDEWTISMLRSRPAGRVTCHFGRQVAGIPAA